MIAKTAMMILYAPCDEILVFLPCYSNSALIALAFSIEMPLIFAISSGSASRIPWMEPNFAISSFLRAGPIPGMASSLEVNPILPRLLRCAVMAKR